jgi:type IV pilus assembly protein PilA
MFMAMTRMMSKKKRRNAFTLIELIIVLAILAILAALIIPRLSGFTENAKQAADKEAAAVLANACAMYHATNPTDTTITTAELITAGLIVAGDLVTVSTGYATNLSDTSIALTGDVVTVTLDGAGPPADYVITK